MKKPTIAALLNTYGITGPKELHGIIGPLKRPPYTEAYARMLYAGTKPISRKVAAAIREYTGGALTMDSLMGLDNGR